VQTLHDIGIGAVHHIKWARLVLTVLEFALFMRRERLI
jgi:hypothetical protein